MTSFAKVGGAHVAYRTWGDGPPDFLYFEEVPVDMLTEEPRLARCLARLSSIGRVMCFNSRGLGLSDALGRPGAPTLDERLEDAVAVLDAVGCQRATLLAFSFMAHLGIDMAARRPDRTDALVLFNARARWTWAEDYPMGMPLDEAVSTTRRVVDPDADRPTLPNPAPSVANDPAFWEWWERAGHRRASPAMAIAIIEQRLHMDQRPLLDQIECPTLVVQRTDVNLMPSADRSRDAVHSRYLADHIPNAKLVELPGNDMMWWVGDADAIIDEIELFVAHGGPRKAKRALASVLFVDVVGSTQRAVDMGDRRWRALLQTYTGVVSATVARFGGRLVGMEGDGALATFELPAQAIECARAIRQGALALGMEVRAGVHTGEIEILGDDVAGVGVHIAARVMSAAGPGELLASRTVVDLVTGSGIEFEERGEHDLKGVPGRWALYAAKA